MNLASRCREAITHVAMLKKELAMQQKRTAEALAAQREQTQRMADSLTNNMELSRLSRSSSDEDEEKSDIILRIMSATPSPVRTVTVASESPASSSSSSSGTLSSNRSGSPVDEAREAPPAESPIAGSAVVTRSPNGDIFKDVDEDDTVEDTIGKSTGSVLPTDEGVKEPIINVRKLNKDEKLPTVYSTPKRSTDRWTPTFHETDRTDGGLFPFSASPKTFTSHSSTNPASYNEGFPSDIIEKPSWSRPPGSRYCGTPEVDDLDEQDEDELAGVLMPKSTFSPNSGTQQQRKVNLISNIDAFEKSFTTDFPESFTPKESASSSDRKERTGEIYNPFLPTPERLLGSTRSALSESIVAENGHDSLSGRRKIGSDQSLYKTSEEKKVNEPCEASSFENKNIYETPPKGDKVTSNVAVVEPGRPEKTMSSAARARYEKALQPRHNNGSLRSLGDSNKSLNVAPVEASLSSSSNVTAVVLGSSENGSPSALLQRIQQKRMNKFGQNSPVTTDGDPQGHGQAGSTPESVIEILDAYEGTMEPEGVSSRATNGNLETDSSGKNRMQNGGHHSISARLLSIKNSRRSVKQPVSYAEPALNTKLRRGDTYFPKSGSPAQQTARSTPVVSPGDTAVH
jgi:hypothetical protein